MTARKRKSRTDWAKVDAHKITPEEYADMPEWTDDQIERAELSIGGRVIRRDSGKLTKRGRPRSEAPKRSVHLRLSPDVLARQVRVDRRASTRRYERQPGSRIDRLSRTH